MKFILPKPFETLRNWFGKDTSSLGERIPPKQDSKPRPLALEAAKQILYQMHSANEAPQPSTSQSSTSTKAAAIPFHCSIHHCSPCPTPHLIQLPTNPHRTPWLPLAIARQIAWLPTTMAKFQPKPALCEHPVLQRATAIKGNAAPMCVPPKTLNPKPPSRAMLHHLPTSQATLTRWRPAGTAKADN